MHIKSVSNALTKIICGTMVSCMLCLSVPAGINNTILTVEAADPAAYSAVFSSYYYLSHNPDLARVLGEDKEALLDHFIEYGMKEGRQGNAEFNVLAYKAMYPDLQAAFGDDLPKYYQHYIEFGKKEGRNGGGSTINTTAQTSTTTTTTGTTTQAPASTSHLDTSSFDAFKESYFSKSVFIGDSVMTGFRNYSECTATASTHSSKFLANVGFALYNSSNAVTSSSKHPTYQGKKDYVWNNITLMDVDRAFIMFGANELVSFSPDKVIPTYYIPFIQKIMAAKPGIEINVISMPPVYAGTNKGHLNQPNVNAYNQLLKEMCANNGWHYIDITAKMKDSNGDMVAAYSSDRYVHMNNKGYAEAWAPAMDNYANSIYSQMSH